MKFKEYLFTSLVFVNLAIGASNLRAEDYTLTNKKNKEVLKVSFNQAEVHATDVAGFPISFYEQINSIETLLLIGLVIGAIIAFSEQRNFLNIKKTTHKTIKNVSRETFLFKRAVSKVKLSHYLGINLRTDFISHSCS